jgi:hypothetical protein
VVAPLLVPVGRGPWAVSVLSDVRVLFVCLLSQRDFVPLWVCSGRGRVRAVFGLCPGRLWAPCPLATRAR